MMNSSLYLFVIILLFEQIWCGIDVPRNDCVWISGDYGHEIKCDGNQVVVGACGYVYLSLISLNEISTD